MTSLHQFSLVEQSKLIHTGELLAYDLTTHYLKRIAELNPKLGAFISITAENALQRAEQFDREYDSMRNFGILEGLPTADKDLDNRTGVPTSFGSRTAELRPATSNDPITDAADAAGLISLGKTHAPEFGLTGNAISDLDHVSRNPWDENRDPGGSSSGAAVAVSSGMIPVALASDAGGSIRIPAATTGCVGVKPSRQFFHFNGHKVTNRNTVSGPIARTVTDAALLIDGLSQPQHSWDNARFTQAIIQRTAVNTRQARIAVVDYTPWREVFDIVLDDELGADFERSTQALQRTGHRVEQITIPLFHGYAAAFQQLWQRSASRILVKAEQEPLLTDFTRWLREQGSQYSDEQISSAQEVMQNFEKFFTGAVADYDAVLTPGLGLLPQPISWHDEPDGEQNFIKQCLYSPYTSFVNMTGQPAVILPTALSAEQLPMSVQLIGQFRDEERLLTLAADLEAELGWEHFLAPQYR